MSRIDDEDRKVLRARELHLEGSGSRVPAALAVRPEIAASWQRSLDKLLDPSRTLPDFQRPAETKLSAAALPVVDHYLASLVDTRTSLLLADAGGRLIGRWTHDSALRTALSRSHVEAGFTMSEDVVGTNGVGTVFETGGAVEISGPEHFADQYLDFTCVGTPIRHPLTRRVVGVVDITCRTRDASPLAMSWITNVARHIEARLLDQATVRERALLSAYLMTARTSKVAVACLGGQLLICNPTASALLSDADQNHIWAHLQRNGFGRAESFGPVDLPGGRVVMLRARPVRQDGVVLGAVIEAFEPPAIEATAREPRRPTRRVLPGLAGESDRWLNVCAQALRWRQEDGGIVVTGEAGVGKLAVLTAAFVDEEMLRVVDCSLVAVDGAQVWLAGLRTRLQDPDGMVVLRHLDTLDVGVAQTVCSILDGVERPPRLAATVVTGEGRQAFGPLVDRFEVHRLDVPPLRHRLDDLSVLLAELSGNPHGGGPRWLPDTVRVLAEHAWPDNVRGLRAFTRRVLQGRVGGVVTVADLPGDVVVTPTARCSLTQLERLERQEIVETLAAVGGNKVMAARRLKLARSTLYRKMAALDVHDPPIGRARR